MKKNVKLQNKSQEILIGDQNAKVEMEQNDKIVDK